MRTACSALSLCTECELLCNMCLRSTYILSDPALMSPRQIPVHLQRIDADCEQTIECRSLCLPSSVSPLARRQWLSGRQFGLKTEKRQLSVALAVSEPEWQMQNVTDRCVRVCVWVCTYVCVPAAALCSATERQSTGSASQGWHHQSGMVSAASVSGLGCSSSPLYPERSEMASFLATRSYSSHLFLKSSACAQRQKKKRVNRALQRVM